MTGPGVSRNHINDVRLRRLAWIPALAALWLNIAPAATPSTTTRCDRHCLEGLVDSYLAALVAHDPTRAPLARDVRSTENGATVATGEGLWRTAGRATDYRIYIADVPAGQAGFVGTILQTDGKPLMLALRLKVADGAIHEIEAITGAPFELPGSPLLASPRPALARAVPAPQRLSREQMIAVAERNFDGVVAGDGSHFAADCQRVENRMAMSGNPKLDYPIATLPGKPKPAFAAMGCKEQVESHLFDTLDNVGSRRYLVIDEERQLVFGVFMLNWYRDTQCNEVRNYGRVCRPPGQKPTGLRTAEILRVAGGKVHEVEVVFSFAPYEAPSGWESSLAERIGKWRAELPQGTGPHRVVRLIEPEFPEYTVYRPGDMKRSGKLPVIAFANGACRNTSIEYAGFLSELASHGYLIIAVGRDDNPFDLGPNAPATAPDGRPLQVMDVKVLTDAVDWAIARNADAASTYYHRVRTNRIAYMGHSCGGMQALTASADPRTTTTVVLNSGYYRTPPARPPGPLPVYRRWSELHAPTIIFTGGPSDVAYRIARDSYEDGVAAKVPMFLASLPTMAHSGAYVGPDREWSRVVLAWLDWQLKGDRKASAQFLGDHCGLCTNSTWQDVAGHGLRAR